MLKYIITLTTILLLNVSITEAQFPRGLKIATGLTTTTLLGDNPAKQSLVPRTDEEDAVFGGALRHPQPGLELRFIMPVDEKSTFYVPFTFEYSFFTGRERLNRSQYIVEIWSHSLNVFSISSGLQANFYKMDFANAQIYAGIEGRISFLSKFDYRSKRYYLEADRQELWVVKPKEDATRIGGTFRLGVEGKLRDLLHVNAGFALSSLNLIGKDNERGELFSPSAITEVQESTINTLQVFILLQFNL